VLTGQGPDLLPQGCSVESPAVVKEMSRSKFVVSPTVAEFNRVTKGGGHRVGVVATPCQAPALGKLRANPLASCSARAEQLKLVLGLFCGWALDWRSAVQLLGKHIDLSEIEGMDIPPSEYAALQVFAKTGTLSVPLDVVSSCIRPSCLSCDDLTAEFSDLSVGSARLPEGWQEAKDWNQLIVRTWRGEELLDLARTRGVLEFRPVPEGSLPTLKAASVNKKRSALRSALGQ
jgi:coenzyme F420 hydrogenase subunit beta